MKNSVSKKLVNLDADDQEIMEGGAVKKMKTNDGLPKPISLLEQAQACGKKKCHTLLDLAVIRLFCIHGLPTPLVGTPEWKDIFAISDPSYRPANHEKLEVEQIVGEAEHIYDLQLKHLRGQENLTISCDGGTCQNGDAFWILHVSTEQGEVYFMEGREAMTESHTAEWVFC